MSVCLCNTEIKMWFNFFQGEHLLFWLQLEATAAPGVIRFFDFVSGEGSQQHPLLAEKIKNMCFHVFVSVSLQTHQKSS